MVTRSYTVRLEAEYGGFVRAMQGAANAVEGVGKAADKASQRVELATARQADAAGRLRTAEAQLEAARSKNAANSSQVVGAEERVAKARRDLDRATEDLVTAEAAHRKALLESAAAAKQNESAMGRMFASISKNEQHLNTLSNGLAMFGAAATLAAGIAVKRFADFDEAMSGVAATGEDARGSLHDLREAAIAAGADTAFSATEAAGAIEELAKAGVTAQEILGGALAGSLDLAAAGGLGVAESAEYASIAMTQFKLGGEDVTHVADLLSAGAGKAMGDVSDLGQALKQGGLVAAQTGLSIEETTGALAAFASAGLLGSDAGTSLKTMLQRLTPQSKEAEKQFDALGISAYDANGQFVGLADFAGQLETAMQDLTPEARNSAMAVMFGSDAVRAASVLYDQGETGIRKWISAVDDQGYAATTAATRLDNLKGDLESLGGSLETVFIRSGSGANDVLRNLVQGADSVVDAIGGIPEPVLSATTLIAGAGGLAVLGVAGLGKLAVGANDARVAMQGLGISAKTAGIAAAGVGTALAVGTLAFAAWAQKAAEARARTDEFKTTLDGLGQTTDTTVEAINAGLVEAQLGWMAGNEKLTDFAKSQGVSMETMRRAILGEADAYTEVRGRMEDYVAGGNLIEKVSGSRGERANRLLGYLEDERDELQKASDETKEKTQADEEAGVAQEGLASALQGTTGAMGFTTTAIQEQSDAMSKWLGEVGQSAQAFVDWTAGLEEAEYSLDGWLTGLEDQVSALQNWSGNIQKLIDKGASRELIEQLIELGPAGAQAVKDLANGTEDDLGRAEGALTRTGEIITGVQDKLAAGFPVEVDSASAESDLAGLLTLIDSAEGTITVDGDMRPAGQVLESATAAIDEASGTVTIYGEDGQALTTLSDFTSTVDAEHGTVTIRGNDSRGRATVVSLTSWTNGQGAAINVGANTGPAASELGSFMASWNGRTIRMNVVTNTYSASGPSGGTATRPPGGYTGGQVGQIAGYAGGGSPQHEGRVPGTPPVDPRRDNRLAFTETGRPLLVRSREWIVNEQSSDHYGDGIMGALNRREIPRDVLGSLVGLATGGRVDWARKQRDASRRRYEAARADVSAAKKAVSRASKTDSKADDKAAAKALKDAEKAFDAAKDNYDEWKDRVRRLDEGTRELRTDVRGGDIVDQASSGLSGAYSVIDRMWDDSRNTDLSKGARSSLAKNASAAEKAMRGLYAQVERVEKRLEGARDRLAELRQISDRVVQRLSGEQSLAGSITGAVEGSWKQVTRTNSRGETWNEDVWDPGTKATVTSKDLVADAQAKAAQIKGFALKLRKLQQLGLSGVVMEEIAALGTEQGSLVADALIAGGKADVADLNAAYKDIDTWSNRAGQVVTEGFYKGGVAAAEGLVKGLESQQASLEKSITAWAKKLEKAFKKAWGIASPSKVFRSHGQNAAESVELGMNEKQARVAKAAERLAWLPTAVPMTAAVAAANGGAGGQSFDFSGWAFSGPDPEAAARKAASRVSSLLASRGLVSIAQGG